MLQEFHIRKLRIVKCYQRNQLNLMNCFVHIHPKVLHLNIKDPVIERTIYNRIISKNFSIYRDLINHYDLFPTILHLLNFSFENNRLGLGFSAVKNTDINYYNNYFKNLEENIQNKSSYYVEFWK